MRKQAIDLQRVISWVKINGFREIHLVGASLGGTVSLLALPLPIKSLILWNPAFDLKNTDLRLLLTPEKQKELARKGYVLDPSDPKIKIGKTFLQEIPSTEVYNRVKLITVPLLIVHGVSDSLVPATQSTRAFSLAKDPKSLKLIDGADHCFPPHQKTLFSLTIDFLSEHR